MRVTGPNGPTPLQARGGNKDKNGSGFTLGDSKGAETGSSVSASSAGSVQGLDALLALQSVGLEGEDDRRATRYGHDVLDQLEALRADLLIGSVPPARLFALKRLLNTNQAAQDPELKALVDDIALRARVELAKLGVDF